MDAEEIISAKEWHELSADEKTALHELASDEQEYNLLKKMMQISAEMPDTAPVVDPSVQQLLADQMKPVRPMLSWYRLAVAAAVVLFTAGLLFVILRKEMKEPEVVHTIPSIKKDAVTPLVKTTEPDSTATNDLVKKDSGFDKTVVSNTPKKNTPQKKSAPVFKNLQTDIAADSSLLAFVSEVY